MSEVECRGRRVEACGFPGLKSETGAPEHSGVTRIAQFRLVVFICGQVGVGLDGKVGEGAGFAGEQLAHFKRF
jgi:hypothetical protein